METSPRVTADSCADQPLGAICAEHNWQCSSWNSSDLRNGATAQFYAYASRIDHRYMTRGGIYRLQDALCPYRRPLRSNSGTLKQASGRDRPALSGRSFRCAETAARGSTVAALSGPVLECRLCQERTLLPNTEPSAPVLIPARTVRNRPKSKGQVIASPDLSLPSRVA